MALDRQQALSEVLLQLPGVPAFTAVGLQGLLMGTAGTAALTMALAVAVGEVGPVE